jgi:quercetin dioxygenase-like cupin family protein
MIKFIRIFTGNDQQSHFENLDILYNMPISVEQMIMGQVEELDAREIGWHNPPVSQYVVMLKGSMEIEIGDGSTCIFNPGDILLAEDTTGQGHNTRAASEGKLLYLIIKKGAFSD